MIANPMALLIMARSAEGRGRLLEAANDMVRNGQASHCDLVVCAATILAQQINWHGEHGGAVEMRAAVISMIDGLAMMGAVGEGEA